MTRYPHSRGALFLMALLIAASPSLSPAQKKKDPPPVPTAGLAEEMLAGPLADLEEVILSGRTRSGDFHWYANIGYDCRRPDSLYPGRDGFLARVNIHTGKMRLLLHDPEGTVRDPCLSYDASKVIFAYRKGGEKTFHLYEMPVDQPADADPARPHGLEQLTDGIYDDVEPIYLPDGGIMFSSTRCKRWVPCWYSPVTLLYRCDADGSNIRQLSNGPETECSPWMLPDGRVIYTRWEYIFRAKLVYHHLWTINPDGTRQAVYFGNMNEHESALMTDARQIPGTSSVVMSYTPKHGLHDHLGLIAVADVSAGPDRKSNLRVLTPGAKKVQRWADPYPISENCFLVAREQDLCVMDAQGRWESLFRLPKPFQAMVQDPRPLRPRPMETVIPSAVDTSQTTGTMVLQSVHFGRDMEGVEPGTIKDLVVVELTPKPLSYQSREPISVGGTFNIVRILGTVGVESDGSAHFRLPAGRPVFFIARDAQGKMVKRMRSWVSVMPGETTSCVGCHEARTTAALRGKGKMPLALARQPDLPSEIQGVAQIPDFPRDIQPILDRHCVKCHNRKDRAGGMNLSGDRTTWASQAYLALRAAARGAGEGTLSIPPYGDGAHRGGLGLVLEGKHKKVKLTRAEEDTLRLWVNTGVQFAGTYAALDTGSVAVPGVSAIGYAHEPQVDFDIPLVRDRCDACHLKGQGRRVRRTFLKQENLNLSLPAWSRVVRAPLATSAGGLGLCKTDGEGPIFASTEDKGYQELLGRVKQVQQALKDNPRYTMEGFRLGPDYVREMKRYGVLPWDFDPESSAFDPYAIDETYFRLFYPKGQTPKE